MEVKQKVGCMCKRMYQGNQKRTAGEGVCVPREKDDLS